MPLFKGADSLFKLGIRGALFLELGLQRSTFVAGADTVVSLGNAISDPVKGLGDPALKLADFAHALLPLAPISAPSEGPRRESYPFGMSLSHRL